MYYVRLRADEAASLEINIKLAVLNSSAYVIEFL